MPARKSKKQPWWEECRMFDQPCNTARAIAASTALCAFAALIEPGGIGGRDLEILHASVGAEFRHVARRQNAH